jgi:DNA (cytosine-5)-methyltransferase 1
MTTELLPQAPRVGSLCTGYGGLDLAVANVFGGETVWVADPDPDVSLVLAKRFPGVPNLGDITAIDWSRRVARVDSLMPLEVAEVDILTAGYPCQPFSVAGHRKGANDDRHLWPYVFDAICHLRPRLVVLENVAGHLNFGFDEVLGDLAGPGFDAEWIVLPASDVGAPHRRERLFVIAYPNGQGPQGRPRHQAEDRWPRPAPLSRRHRQFGVADHAVAQWEAIVGRDAPSPLIDGDRLRAEFSEWMMGLPAGWVTDVLPRRPALRVLGNGVVPQQAEAALRMLTS